MRYVQVILRHLDAVVSVIDTADISCHRVSSSEFQPRSSSITYNEMEQYILKLEITQQIFLTDVRKPGVKKE